jgi:N-acetylneuraminate synthase
VVKDLKAGDSLTSQNVRAIRPGLGLPPKYIGVVMGKKVKSDMSRGTALGWNSLE